MSLKRRAVTTNTRRLAHENIRSELELGRELSRIEKERAATLRELDNETKLFRLNSASPTKTGEPPVALAISPRIDSSVHPKPRYRKVSANGWTEVQELFAPLSARHKQAKSCESLSSPWEINSSRARSMSSRFIRHDASFTSSESSPSSSPEVKRRMSSSTVSQRPAVFYDNRGSPSVRSSKAASGNGQIPQIVISEDGIGSNILPPKLTFQISEDAANRYGSKESLAILPKRNRSLSVPSITHPLAQLSARIADSGQSSTESYDSGVKSPARRSSFQAFSTHRRSPSRRSSIAVDNFIHDLSRGVDHLGIYHTYKRIPRVSPEEWESLKSCRYLRMPNQS